MHRARLITLAAGLAASIGASPAPSLAAAHQADQPARSTPARPPEQPRSFEDALEAELAATVAAIKDDKDLRASTMAFNRLFDLALAHADLDKRTDVLIEAGAWRRALNQWVLLKPDLRARVLPTLLDNPNLARRLALTVGPRDKPEQVYGVLAELIEAHPKAVADSAKLTNLVAAMCVVFDETRYPPRRPDGLTPEQVRQAERQRGSGGSRSGNNQRNARPQPLPGLPPAEALKPAEVFDYFARTAGKMLFSPATTPPELLIYVVDTRAPVNELRWALSKYANNRAIGAVYDTITYDTPAFRYGREKKIWQADGGYTLENIKKVGGVCEEQAYFAAHCGKAIGVPTVDITVAGPDVSHAYVGYLARKGNAVAWDFREGRYDEYEDLCGHVTDPQSGRVVSASQVGLSAGLLKCSPRELAAAIVLVDAADRLGGRGPAMSVPDDDDRASGPRPPSQPAYPPTLDTAWPAPKRTTARAADVAMREELLRAAVEQVPGLARAWTTAAELPGLTSAQKNAWCRAAMRLCARDYPDFAVEVVTPMIRTVGDSAAQAELWEWCAKQFSNRPDLVARARFNQAQVWQSARQLGKAWEILKDVAVRYPEDGTVVVDALAAIERLLADEGKPATAAIPVFEDAFRRIGKPGQLSPGFERQSNFYRVGSRLAALYEAAGDKNKAKMTRGRIGEDEG